MVQALVYLDEEEDKIINNLSKKWGISKAETIKTVIKKFIEVSNENS